MVSYITDTLRIFYQEDFLHSEGGSKRIWWGFLLSWNNGASVYTVASNHGWLHWHVGDSILIN